MTSIRSIGMAIEAENRNRVYQDGQESVEKLLPKTQNRFLLHFRSRKTLEDRLTALEETSQMLNTTVPEVITQLENYVTAFRGWEYANNATGRYDGISQSEYSRMESEAHKNLVELIAKVQSHFLGSGLGIIVPAPNELIYSYEGTLSANRMKQYWLQLGERFSQNVEIVKEHLGK